MPRGPDRDGDRRDDGVRGLRRTRRRGVGPGRRHGAHRPAVGRLEQRLPRPATATTSPAVRTSRSSSGAVNADTVWACAVIALFLCVPLSLANGWRAGLVHLAGVAAAWAYNLGLKATRAVPAAVRDRLRRPAGVRRARPARPADARRLWLVAGGALLGVGAHFANVLPDMDDDVATGVVGAAAPPGPYRLGVRLGRRCCSPPTVSLALGPSGGSRAVAVVGSSLACGHGRRGFGSPRCGRARRVPTTMFRSSMALAVLDVTMLLVRGGGLG